MKIFVFLLCIIAVKAAPCEYIKPFLPTDLCLVHDGIVDEPCSNATLFYELLTQPENRDYLEETIKNMVVYYRDEITDFVSNVLDKQPVYLHVLANLDNCTCIDDIIMGFNTSRIFATESLCEQRTMVGSLIFVSLHSPLPCAESAYQRLQELMVRVAADILVSMDPNQLSHDVVNTVLSNYGLIYI